MGVPAPLQAAKAGSLRVGSLKFGSLGWLLETVVAEGLDKAQGFDLELIDMATTGAAKIGLLSGSADVIVSDWPWAMRQRSEGEAVRFAPYSSALGAVMVAGDSPIKNVGDLADKRLGIAGSKLDKSWLLLRAYAQQETGSDIAKSVAPTFGAAPLISEQIRQGRVDAALNFWTFSARLKGMGYREVISMADVLKSMGIAPVPSLVGFIWDEKKTAGKSAEVAKFHAAIRAGNEVLAKSDAAWERIRQRMRVRSDAEFEALKAYYRSGIPNGWSPEHTASAEKLFGLLVKLGERTLAGGKTKFDPALFHGA
ncbi:MAG: ABC transporter substrate-binding protein [Alphaproteobacteria bacterium]|nr:ABC transporter substrate-binding protein [Alphaproteobacteria bacterium]